MIFPKHTCTDIYGAFQQTWFWLKCRFTGLWLHVPVERLSPKVGSIPAFHSVQQNINSLLKYFPYVYMHLSVLSYDQVTVCIATKESDWGHLSICISLYVFNFLLVVVKSGAWKMKKSMTGEGARAFWCQKRKWKSYLWPPLTPPPPHGFINDILTPLPIWGRMFFMTPLKLPSPPPQLINNDRSLNLTWNSAWWRFWQIVKPEKQRILPICYAKSKTPR